MPTWQEKGRGWRYRFQYRGEFYQKSGFKTKGEARAAEAEHRKRLKQPPISTPTATDFKTAAYEYLDFCKRRYVDKTYKKKAYCYKCFQAAVGNPLLSEITAPGFQPLPPANLNTIQPAPRAPQKPPTNFHPRKYLKRIYLPAVARELIGHRSSPELPPLFCRGFLSLSKNPPEIFSITIFHGNGNFMISLAPGRKFQNLPITNRRGVIDF